MIYKERNKITQIKVYNRVNTAILDIGSKFKEELMNKKLQAFRNNPSLKTALAVLKHVRLHPMSAVLVNPIELQQVEDFYQTIIKGDGQ